VKGGLDIIVQARTGDGPSPKPAVTGREGSLLLNNTIGYFSR